MLKRLSSETTASSPRVAKIKRFLKTTALILLVLFAVAPIILAAIPGTESAQTYSIYNESYDGYSIIRKDLETQKVGEANKYEALNIISNLNVLNRFDRPNASGALVIAGPAANYDLTETISVILYLLRGGSVIIMDDFGTGNQILDPIFDAFQNIQKFSEEAENLGFPVPSFDDIVGGSGNDSSSEDNGESSGTTKIIESFGAGNEEIASDIGGSFMTELIGKVILRFAFNHTGVLMDALSNNESPVRPIITEIDHSDIELPLAGGGSDKFTYTEGVERIQLEFATIITILVNTNVPVLDEFGAPKLDENGTAISEKIPKWQPLQKLSSSLLTGGDEGVDIDLPFFPFYSSKQSWIETSMSQAADGTAEPDIGEWGNTKFATALTIPLFPGFGKLIFIADPSIFINRWTADVSNNDNLLLFRNLIDMATFTQKGGVDSDGNYVPIPIIFDFGHTYQGLLSPSLYSTALMKLIAQMSMFPFYAPFVPLAAYGYGKKLMPETRRLRPILLTKRRGEKGHSDFEKKLEDIKVSGGYGEPIMHLSRRLVRQVQGDVRFTGLFAKNPKEMASFLSENYPDIGSRRELQSQLSQVFRIAENPTRRINYLAAKKYLALLKKLLDLFNR
ncbi:MAG: hypothetical protein HeimC2_43590 [Candidatus Heimdallarchaeota archaeon LC_2]|nr:MAG: hypothetical protein HeimC2_43590 [Candidatus Heimdallarchaeota archaeon LC_2]